MDSVASVTPRAAAERPERGEGALARPGYGRASVRPIPGAGRARVQAGSTERKQLHFGEWLLAEGVLNEGQLQEALRSQSVYGGRLGTNLVEIGYLRLEELAEHLTRFHGLTLAPVDWVENPDPKAIHLVPMALIRRHKLLPLHVEREALHVAMLDPQDREQLDFVSTAANRPVIPYVLPEIRLLYWLETHLQIDRHPRFVNLATRLRRTDMVLSDGAESSLGHTLRAPGSPAPAPTPAPEPAAGARDVLDQWFEDDVLRPEPEAAPVAPAAAPRSAPAPESVAPPPSAAPEPARPTPPATPAENDVEEELLLLEELVVEAATPTRSPAREPEGPVSSARVAELEAQLAGAAERDAIAELVLALARVHCEAAVLFLVGGDKVKPFRVSGAVEPRLDEVEVPLGVHSIFAHPAVTGFAFRGTPPEGGIDGRLLEAIGRAHVQDLLVQPISIRDRVVNLLYCDNGSNAFGETSIAALGAVADCAARAYERLILDRKRQRGSS